EPVVTAQVEGPLKERDCPPRFALAAVQDAETGQGRGQPEGTVPSFSQPDGLRAPGLAIGEIANLGEHPRHPAANQDRSVRSESARGKLPTMGLDHLVEAVEVRRE